MSDMKTVCSRDCYDTCFMEVTVRDGKPVRTMGDKENPVTQGVLCPRGYKDIERAYSDERILYPHIHSGSMFERISWDDALYSIIENLHSTINAYGSEACLQLSYSGNQGLFSSHVPQRLFYALGFTQTDQSICSKSGHDALSLHYGMTYGADPEELLAARLIVYWGFNAAVSAPHVHRLSVKSQKEGSTIAAVDPRKSETAQSADLWIQPRPGSDVALAYGIMKHLIDNQCVDFTFIDEHTHGFRDLKREVEKWDSRTVEEFTGLKWDTVETLAELYARGNPSVTMIGIGMQKSLHGAESVRSVSLIPALLGLHRGFYYTNYQGYYIDYPYLTGEMLTEKSPSIVSQVAVGPTLEEGKFKFVYVHNMNPVATLPNAEAVKRGFQRDDTFVVVHDTHWTETAQCADLVLPAPTFLEKEDIIVSYSHRYIRKSEKVVEPLGESRNELWISQELAERLQLTEKWLYEDPWKAVEKAFQNAFENGSFLDLKRGTMVQLRMKPKNEYQTPTGKMEFSSKEAENQGIAPLPKQYPLSGNGFIFLNSATKNYTHTQFQDIYGPIPPIVFVNLKDAREYNIQDTDVLELYNDVGSIKLKAVVSVSVPPGVLWAPRQGKDIEGVFQNSTIPNTTQTIGGGPIFNSTVVRIRKSKG